jgi:hypothetical protein
VQIELAQLRFDGEGLDVVHHLLHRHGGLRHERRRHGERATATTQHQRSNQCGHLLRVMFQRVDRAEQQLFTSGSPTVFQ